MHAIAKPSPKFLSLLSKKEDTQTEFKSTISSCVKIAKQMTAMANTLGGNIIIGVNDRGEITGVDNPSKERKRIVEAAQRYCIPPLSPQIEEIAIKGKILLWVIIASGNGKHLIRDTQGNTRCYVRVQDKSLLTSKSTARRLQQGPSIMLGLNHLNKHEKMLISLLAKQQKITLKAFSHKANISKRRALRMLTRLERAAIIRSHDFEKKIFYTLNPARVKK